jgi:hypothetical protein
MFEQGQFLLFLAVVALGTAVYFQQWVVIDNKKAGTCTTIGFKSAGSCDSSCAECASPVPVATTTAVDGTPSACVFVENSPEQLTCLLHEQQHLFLAGGAACIVAAAVLAIVLAVGSVPGILAAAGSASVIYAGMASTSGVLTSTGKTAQLIGSGCTADYCANPGVSAGLSMAGALLAAAATLPVFEGEDPFY